MTVRTGVNRKAILNDMAAIQTEKLRLGRNPTIPRAKTFPGILVRLIEFGVNQTRRVVIQKIKNINKGSRPGTIRATEIM